MTRLMRALALAVVVAFVAAGCAKQGKSPVARKPVAAKNGAASDKDKSTSTSDAKADDEKAKADDEKAKADSKQPTKPDETSDANPSTPKMERPKVTKIEGSKVGLPIYPGAEVLNAQEMTWSKGPMGVLRTAMLTSTDQPDKILKWYRDKIGGDAEIKNIDQMSENRKGAFIYYRDAKTGLVKSVSVIWTAEKPGVATDLKIHLNVREMAKGTK